MISLAADAAQIHSFLASERSVFAVKQRALLEIYGNDCDFWFLCGDPGPQSLLISRLSGTLTLCGTCPTQSLAELRAFLCCMGGIAEGDTALLERLAPLAQPEHLPVMTHPAPQLPPLPQGLCIAHPQRLSEVYELLCESDQAFAASFPLDVWLTDFSHRCRHGHSDCFILIRKDEMIATCSILFRAFGRALAGALAVRPNQRGSGYGSLLLSHMAAIAASKKEQLTLLAANSSLANYYRRHGWIELTVAARIHLTGNDMEDL